MKKKRLVGRKTNKSAKEGGRWGVRVRVRLGQGS
jgi:hypothetical protein